MKQKTNALLAAALCSLFALNQTAHAQGTAFTYQGRLNTTNGPATGSYDLTFTLFNTNTLGSPASVILTNTGTPVSNGLFTIALDFGSGPYISGAPLWLEIGARTNGAATFFTLEPRQEVLSAPYATYAYSVNASSLIGPVTDANLATTFTAPHTFSNPSDSFTGNGSGLTALNASNITTGTIADLRLSTNVALRLGGNIFAGNQIVTNGNVGIGTSAPVAQFHVVTATYGSQPVAIFDVDNCGGPCAQQPYQENIRLVNLNPNGQTGLSFLTSTNNADNLSAVPAAWIGTGYTSFNDNSLIFASQVGGALVDRMYLQGTNGFLGIGTDSPGQMLEVNGNARIDGTLTASNFTGNGSNLTALNASNITTGTLPAAQLPASVVLSNATGLGIVEGLLSNGIALTALNASNITTGTIANARLSTNVAMLNSINNFTGGQNTFTGNVGVGTMTPQVTLDLNDTRTGVFGSGAQIGLTDFYPGTAETALIDSVGNGGGYTWRNGAVELRPVARVNIYKGSDVTSSGTVAFTVIGSNGNVGIGTTAPANALDVQGSADFSGYVGVGTTSPGSPLTVNSRFYGIVQSYSNNDIAMYIDPADPTGVASQFGTDTQSSLGLFVNNGYPILVINTNGNVGINTATPANSLDVQGGADFTGNVGIGTTTPTGHLSVVTLNGTVSITDDSFTPDLVMTGGPVPGDLRVRNRIEMWPNTNATVAGYFDVRTTNGTPTINLSGSNGVVTCVAMDITSDRNAKKDFKALNPRDVLAKVAALPITEWQYKIDNSKDAAAPRHIGPMAQDFSAAFELSHDDRHISVGDEGGVALAAIQGLNEELKETRAENAALKQTVAELKNMMEQIQRSLPASQDK